VKEVKRDLRERKGYKLRRMIIGLRDKERENISRGGTTLKNKIEIKLN
jgi:hypothetical protein